MAGKALYIAEKPSVAREFAAALHETMRRCDGYLESEHAVVTWCVGHLVTMSYPDAYDPALKKWSFETLPFLPKTFRYEVIAQVKQQFEIVKGLLLRPDVETIYVCTDAGREGEYIYRLVAQEAGVPADKPQKRVWIDSQTEDEILRGIREAKDLQAYEPLSDAAYLRAKEDYLMGINFSRVLSLRYARDLNTYLESDYQAIAVGRVMTCVLGMVVKREREIRHFTKTPFYRVIATQQWKDVMFPGEWRAVHGSRYEGSSKLYKENGFRERADAETLIRELEEVDPQQSRVEKIEKKTQKKNPPLLYNLAELQNDASRYCKISPDATLQIAQELYEKKLVTYPRTDARVLSSTIAKEIRKNLSGLTQVPFAAAYAQEILDRDWDKAIGKSRYTNDKQVTDHYALIPTGQGLASLRSLSPLSAQVYEMIVRRFLSIFYPPAVYQKVALETVLDTEHFFSNFKILTEEGYLKVAYRPGNRNSDDDMPKEEKTETTAKDAENTGDGPAEEEEAELSPDAATLETIQTLRKGSLLSVLGYEIKEGETKPPKRYTSGSMILAMENAGQLIEDEELREQIKGSGIGTSATRAEILKKLFNIRYLSLANKTQVITPTQRGEMIYDVVFASIRSLLNPELTASWEKGLAYVEQGKIDKDEYMKKLESFVGKHTESVRRQDYRRELRQQFDRIAPYYARRTGTKQRAAGRTGAGKKRAK